jgi:hypothetical protein
MATIRVKEVQALAGFKLAVVFSDGTRGEVDMSSHVQRKPFLKLQDEAVFRGAIVEFGAVEWPGGDVGIATEALYALAHDLERPTTLKEARANEQTVSLRELRKFLGKTQAEVAASSDLTQGAVALFEGADDHKLSALRRYLTALGCELEIHAVVDGKRFPIHGL